MVDQAPSEVIAVVTQSPIQTKQPVLHMMPGIHLAKTSDALDQQYRTPQQAVASGAHLVIVGRGITQHDAPGQAAAAYQRAGWTLFEAEK